MRAGLNKRKTVRGFAIIMVLILLAVLMGGIAVLFGVLTSTGRTAGSMLDRRKSFYQCDGTARVITKIAQDFTLESDDPANLGDGGTNPMQQYVCEKTGSTTACTAPILNTIIDPGYEVESFRLAPLGPMQPSVIQSGAFANMQAQEMPILLKLAMRRTVTGNRCEIEQEVSIGSISMFQFFLFAETNLDWSPGADSTIYGRVHGNSDICLGSGATLTLQNVTAAGNVYSFGNTTQCGGVTKAENVDIWQGGTNPYPANVARLDTTTDRVALGAGWAAAANSTWGGALQDSAHGVSPLRLPIASGIEVQPSYESDGTTVASNAGSTRYLVDPVMAGDNSAQRAVKLSCKADLRIINGVWYLASEYRSAADPCGGWPGTPIWSDHPGRWTPRAGAANENEENLLVGTPAVGQLDIAANVSPAWSTPPRRYSYYRFQSTGNIGRITLPVGGIRPVISYGPLALDAATGTRLVPAHWVFMDDAIVPEVCGSQVIPHVHNDPFNDNNLLPYDHAECGGTSTQREQALLDGARTGIVDPQILEGHPFDGDAVDSDPSEYARFIPINFDVEAFRAALADTGNGELGSYFAGAGREFNGIVYITNTWDKSLDGFGTTSTFAGGDTIFPSQGDFSNSDLQPLRGAPNASTTSLTPGLPYALCSSPTVAGEIVGDAMTNASLPDFLPFKVPNCHDYAEVGHRAIPFRVIHAREIGSAEASDNDVLPNGLTIASNAFGYLQGDANTEYGGAAPTDAKWVPFLIGADNLRFLSNAWNDEAVPWGDQDEADNGGNGSAAAERLAVPTTYNLCMVGGHTVTRGGEYSGGVENFPGFLENWPNVNATYSGSMVKGFSPVYLRFPQRGRKNSAPNRPWSYDQHLNSLDNQPPGAPRFDIQAVRTWRR